MIFVDCLVPFLRFPYLFLMVSGYCWIIYHSFEYIPPTFALIRSLPWHSRLVVFLGPILLLDQRCARYHIPSISYVSDYN